MNYNSTKEPSDEIRQTMKNIGEFVDNATLVLLMILENFLLAFKLSLIY